ncbi:hypothetical protein G5B10_13820 [Fluviicola sp. SGL-29]|nr:hypothetical protein [Fluviicola sp. SGL-29]
MKHLLTALILIAFSPLLTAQTTDFPTSWEGNWKGEVAIFSANGNHNVPMSLVIQPIDSVRWSWTLHYEAPHQSPRKYELIKGKSGWNIDEKNGIVLPQQFIGNRLASSFSVEGNLLICYYWLEGDVLYMELNAIALEPGSKTGTNAEEAIEVGNHLIGSLQQAKLHRK